nr:hypothetical protein [Tanacetum cinerariifolium]
SAQPVSHRADSSSIVVRAADQGLHRSRFCSLLKKRDLLKPKRLIRQTKPEIQLVRGRDRNGTSNIRTAAAQPWQLRQSSELISGQIITADTAVSAFKNPGRFI